MRTCRSRLAFVGIGAVLALVPVDLLPQPIYRCGNSYSQTPCAHGIVVHADDLRTPDQKAQSDAATLQAARLADRLERERLASERRSVHAGNRPAKARHAEPSDNTARAAARSTSPEGEPRTRARSQPPAPEHFTATTRQDPTRKPATAPSRDRPATR